MRLIDIDAIRIKPDMMQSVYGMAVIRVEDLHRILMEQPTIERSQWISVKDRLPVGEKDPLTGELKYVLCATDYGVRAFQYGMRDWDKRLHFLNENDFAVDEQVTHWMPMPEMPNGEHT